MSPPTSCLRTVTLSSSMNGLSSFCRVCRNPCQLSSQSSLVSPSPPIPPSLPPSLPPLTHTYCPTGPNATASRGEDPCLVVQHYHLCRATSSLSLPAAPKEGVALPNLVDVVVSPFYPQQATAYLLAKRSESRVHSS